MVIFLILFVITSVQYVMSQTGNVEWEKFKPITQAENHLALFGFPQFTHYNVGAGHQHVVVISNVDDGDADLVQKITFGFINNATDKIILDSISYTQERRYALLYFRDLGITGNASVTVTCIHEEGINLG